MMAVDATWLKLHFLNIFAPNEMALNYVPIRRYAKLNILTTNIHQKAMRSFVLVQAPKFGIFT